MSGDVQPRKRKDKKKKRDDEPKEIHHGVHATKMGSDDVHLHVQSDHETGGHWCAKIFFFSLLAILLGLVGLIILENRGLSDLDTPLSESRFSEYFDGWVDENRQAHEEHDKHVAAGIKQHDDDHEAEPFEEEEDHSEQVDDHSEQEDDDEGHDEKDDEEQEDEDEQSKEVNTSYDVDDDEEEEQQTKEDNDDEDEEEEEEEQQQEDDDDDDDNNDTKEINEPVYENTRVKRDVEYEKPDEDDTNNDEGFEDDDNLNDTDDDKEVDDDEEEETLSPPSNQANDDDPFEEEDDDDDFDDNDDSIEDVVENDAGESLHLRQKAEQEQSAKAAESAEDDDTDSAPQVRQGGGPQYFSEDSHINADLRRANEELLQDNLKSALMIFDRLSLEYPESPGALYGRAKVYARIAEKYRNNKALRDAIDAYKEFLALNDKIDNATFKEAAEACLEKIKFLGLYAHALPIYKTLLSRFKNEPSIRNQLGVTLLLLNRFEEAKYLFHHTLLKWRDDGFAQVHYGFILKNHDKDLESAVRFLQEGINTGANGTQDGRFYFNLGDALYRLGRKDEAMEIYRKGAEKHLFLSQYQRSLYNVNPLKGQPFWTKVETTYEKEFNELEKNWELIRNEGLAALNAEGHFTDEVENLRDKGDWKQLELFMRGERISKNCQITPLTCKIIETFPAAKGCRRGQVKFSVMHPGAHVWPHCGPTNCRLRAHLGLKVPSGTKLRVATEERTWKEGEMLIFDDSFEHEVWHNGTSLRLVLIVDVWHPELTEGQRYNLGPI